MAEKPLFLLAEAWGENEAKIGAALVGASGLELLRMLAESGNITLTTADHEYIRRFWDRGDPAMLDAVWHLHPEVYRSNVFAQRPPKNDLAWFCGPASEGIPGFPGLVGAKRVRREFQHHLERLQDELLSIDPNLVVCLGNAALWALSGKVGISKLRGTTLLSTHTATGYKLLGTYHPAAVLRQWELRPIAVMDLHKAARERAYPEIRRVRREVWIEPTLEDLEEFYEQHIKGCRLLSVDIETSGNQITELGFAPSSRIALVISFIIPGRQNRNYWPSAQVELQAWEFVRRILEDPRIKKLFQNSLFDIAVLYRAYGIKVMGVEHDPMLLHHALQPESLKSLGFLGSVYGEESPWKSEHKAQTIKRDS